MKKIISICLCIGVLLTMSLVLCSCEECSNSNSSQAEQKEQRCYIKLVSESTDWIEVKQISYWSNGVCMVYFYDGSTLTGHLSSILVYKGEKEPKFN